MQFVKPKKSNALAKITLNSLMQLYKNNYSKFNTLVDLFALKDTLQLHSTHSPVVIEVELLDRAKYTTTVRMNYLFKDASQEKIPNAEIRIYHDTRQTEILRIQNKERFDSFFSLTHYEGFDNIQARWALNHFLHKWLVFCLKHNYRHV